MSFRSHLSRILLFALLSNTGVHASQSQYCSPQAIEYALIIDVVQYSSSRLPGCTRRVMQNGKMCLCISIGKYHTTRSDCIRHEDCMIVACREFRCVHLDLDDAARLMAAVPAAATGACGSDDERAAVVGPADPDDLRTTDPRSSSISSSETFRAWAKNSLASRSQMFRMWYMFPER